MQKLENIFSGEKNSLAPKKAKEFFVKFEAIDEFEEDITNELKNTLILTILVEFVAIKKESHSDSFSLLKNKNIIKLEYFYSEGEVN